MSVDAAGAATSAGQVPQAEQVLAALDSEQREIATTLGGPLCVLAGAGTGKTRAITHRIAYGVLTGAYSPDAVLAVTFTRKAAAEMQARLRVLGVPGVTAATFHSAALSQLMHFWPDVVGGRSPQLLSSKAAVLGELLEDSGARTSQESLRDIAAEIEWRKTRMLSLSNYAQLVNSRPLPQGISAEHMVDLQQRYVRVLEERFCIDFEDALILLSGMLQTERAVALELRERYRHFTVDEYQDLTPLQHQLLHGWLGERRDLCVVGDASQTIYSFAGADSGYLLGFTREFPEARVVRLERNYRSTPAIITAANRVMRDRPGALHLTPAASSSPTPLPPVAWFASDRDEARAVAENITAQLAAGVPASEIAVLYRINAQSQLLQEALEAAGVAVRVHGATEFYERPDVRRVLLLLRAELSKFNSRGGQSTGGEGSGLAPVSAGVPAASLADEMLAVLRACGYRPTPPETKHERESWETLSVFLRMAEAQPAGTTMQSFAEEVLERARTGHEPAQSAVTLCAVHAAKGLEWHMVHLVGACEGLMPYSLAEQEHEVEEERRLFYVAITRAKRQLFVSGPAKGRGSTGVPSRFIAESGMRIQGVG